MAGLTWPPSAGTISSLLLFVAVVAATNHHQPPDLRSDLPAVTPSTPANATPRSPAKRARGTLAREFVDAHNEVRAEVGHAPLSWNKTLAMFARRLAKRRVGDCKLIHSGGPYGENLFWSLKAHWTPARVVEAWAEERKYYDPKTNSCTGGQRCQHYVQLIWKASRRVGCARVKCNGGLGWFAVCNYDPPGNFKFESPFEEYPNKAAAAPAAGSSSRSRKEN